MTMDRIPVVTHKDSMIAAGWIEAKDGTLRPPPRVDVYKGGKCLPNAPCRRCAICGEMIARTVTRCRSCGQLHTYAGRVNLGAAYECNDDGYACGCDAYKFGVRDPARVVMMGVIPEWPALFSRGFTAQRRLHEEGHDGAEIGHADTLEVMYGVRALQQYPVFDGAGW